MIVRENRVFGGFRGYGIDLNKFLLNVKNESSFYVPVKAELPLIFTTMRKQ